jgi:hypothetical protein
MRNRFAEWAREIESRKVVKEFATPTGARTADGNIIYQRYEKEVKDDSVRATDDNYRIKREKEIKEQIADLESAMGIEIEAPVGKWEPTSEGYLHATPKVQGHWDRNRAMIQFGQLLDFITAQQKLIKDLQDRVTDLEPATKKGAKK